MSISNFKPFRIALYFIVALILLSLVLSFSNRMFRKWAWQKTDWAYTGESFSTQQPEHILIGSSKFYGGAYIPLLPEGSYILSLQYGNSNLLEKIIRQHWEKILRAKTLQLELYPEMFFLDPFVSNQMERLEDLGVATNFLERLRASWSDRNVSILLPSVFKFRLTPQEYFSWKEHRNETPLSEAEIFNKSHGYYKNLAVMPSEKFKKNAADSLNYIQLHNDFSNQGRNFESWIQILEKLKVAGVHFRLVIMPTQEEFRKLQKLNWTEFYSYELPILQKNFEVADFSDHECANQILHPNSMADSAHLNESGAICLANEFMAWMK